MRERRNKGIKGTDSGPATNVLQTYTVSQKTHYTLRNIFVQVDQL